MAEKWKNYYNQAYLQMLADKIAGATDAFDRAAFLAMTEPEIDALEFTGRQELVARALRETMALDYPSSLEVFTAILGPELRGNADTNNKGWWLWPLSKYVELYGLEDFDASIAFNEELTKRFTAEFSMRPLLQTYPERAVPILVEWSTHEHERVRRLASEAIRIRLPWGKKLMVALEYPDEFVTILENLKDDPDKYIQKSVANNLNDLYKDDPARFYAIIDRWKAEEMSKETEWVIRHGSRTARKNMVE